MEEENKNNLTENSTWKRIGYMVLFIITFNVAEIVLAFVVGLQVLFKLLTGKPLDTMAGLGGEIGEYLRQVASFLSFASEDMPYPISAWPSSSDNNAGRQPGDSQPTINL